ncbi:bifunctional glycosyltransferase family 2/GtrA family protein [Angustibacter luteus]|uniref:dolichyl-phosphate beta-glucosyltransferase n=1 Tax=Angustibacter luteus TaxID=658456 RepID=A0ABW1JID0_9ACTN
MTTYAPDLPTTLTCAVPSQRDRGRTATVEVVVPVYNEQHVLAASVRRLHAHLTHQLPYPFRVTIADNASTDGTFAVASELAAELPGVHAVHLDRKGRGHALATVWAASGADVLAYMDVDLSTDLAALAPLVAPLASGHSDLAIGSRLSRGSRVLRGPRREVISRCYNLLLRGTLGVSVRDAQCGFKAIRRDVAEQLLPLVEDTTWFFDTELLVLAERCGLRVHEVPVDWVDDPDSRVDVVRTALDDLHGIVRLGRGLATGRVPVAGVRERLGRGPLAPDAGRPGVAAQVLTFGAIGVLSTLAYGLLFWLVRPAMGAQWANLVALLLTAVANTAANRRFTFGVTGRDGAARHQAQGLVVFALGLAVTSFALAALQVVDPYAGRAVELGVLVVANGVATVLRFVLLRRWVFARASAGSAQPAGGGGGAVEPESPEPASASR